MENASAHLRPWKLAIGSVKQIFGVDNSGGLLADLLDDVIASVADNHAAVYAAIMLRHDDGGRTSEHHFGYLVCLTEGLLPGLEHGALGWGFRNWLRLHKTRPSGCAVVRRRRWLACTGVHGGQCRGRRLAACGARATHAGRSDRAGRAALAVAAPPAAGPAPASAPMPLEARLTAVCAAMTAP